MFDEILFRNVVKNRGVKLKAIANAMQISAPTLYRKIKGQSDFTRVEIQRCCAFLGMENMNDIFFATKIA